MGTTNFTSSLLSKLVAHTQLTVNVLGLGLLGPIATLVSGILGGAVSPLDQLLTNVLQTVGVGLGQADTWVRRHPKQPHGREAPSHMRAPLFISGSVFAWRRGVDETVSRAARF